MFQLTQQTPKRRRIAFLPLVFLGFFLFSTVLAALPTSTASAATTGWTAMKIDASRYSWVSSLGACLDGGAKHKYLTDHVTKGGASLDGLSPVVQDQFEGPSMFRKGTPQWFAGYYDTIDIGHVVPEDDGVIPCSQVPNTAMQELGFSSPADFLPALGYKDMGAYWVPGDINTMKQNLVKMAIAEKVPDGLSGTNGGLKYLFFYYAYLSPACGGAFSTQNIGKPVSILGEDDTVVKRVYAKTDLKTKTVALPHVHEPVDCDEILNNLVGSAKSAAQRVAYLTKSNKTDPCASGTVSSACGNTTGSAQGNAADDPCSVLPAKTTWRWLVCGAMLAMSPILDGLFAAIEGMLVTPNQIFTEDGFDRVISVFRNFGLALVIIAGMVMIIAQATGSDYVDAYTVKKVLPRLGIALIGIALSGPLLKFLVMFVNDIGLLMGNFLSGLGQTTAGPNTGSSGGGEQFGAVLTWVAGLVLGGGYAGISLGAGGLLSLAATLLLGLLVGFIVLTIRQLVIVVLLMLAPLAIAASILPGTDKLWKFWRGTLITTLLMFPIIVMFLASGRLLAGIFAQPSMGGGLFVVVAYVAPYFLLPFAFKMAGGLMGSIFQIANDKSKGAFDRLRNGRDETRKDRKKRAGQGHLFAKGGALDNIGMNTAAGWALDTRDTAYSKLGGRSPFASHRREAARLNSKRGNAIREHTEKLANSLSAFSLNDRAGFAFSGVHEQLIDKDSSGNDTLEGARTRAAITQAGMWGRSINSVEDIDKMAKILSESGNMHNMNAASQLRAVRGTVAAAYHDPEMGRADVATAGMMVAASQGYADAETINTYANNLRKVKDNQGNFITDGKEQYDQNGNLIGNIEDHYVDKSAEDLAVATSLTNRVIGIAGSKRGDVRAGYSNLQDDKGNWSLGGTDRMGQLLLNKTQYSDWTAYKPDTVDAFEPEFIANLGNAQRAEATAGILNMLRNGSVTGEHKIRADAIYARLTAEQRAVVDDANPATIAAAAAAAAARGGGSSSGGIPASSAVPGAPTAAGSP